MDEQGFRRFYQTLMQSYRLPAKTVTRLLQAILSALSEKKERENK